jgi:hypothetical protein
MAGISTGFVLATALLVSGCSSQHATHVEKASSTPGGDVVIQVGPTPITLASYEHWMAIGDATVELPKPGGPLPQPLAYDPPDFTACVDRARSRAPKTSLAALKARCQRTFDGIQARILGFLITGYWLRDQAAAEGVSVSQTEVERQLDEERRAHYPTAASFSRLLEASHQTVSDLAFAVETQILSAKLFKRFTAAHGQGTSEQAHIAAFNSQIKHEWTGRTNCRAGYVMADCVQYR